MRNTFVLAAAIAVAACQLFACSSKPSLKLTLAEGGERTVEPTSGAVYASTKTFSEPDGKGGFKMGKASAHAVFVGTYALDDSRGHNTLGAPLTSESQTRVQFTLIGDDGTEAGGKEVVHVAKGTYSAKADKFRDVEAVTISTYAGGKEQKYTLDRDALDGTVVITSSDAEAVVGEIDVKDGKHTVKGTFTAKANKR